MGVAFVGLMIFRLALISGLALLISTSGPAEAGCRQNSAGSALKVTVPSQMKWQVWREGVSVRIKSVLDSQGFGSHDITLGRAQFPNRGDGLPYHRHSHPELYQVKKGQATITIDGVDYHAVSGDVVIIPGNALHTIHNGGRVPLEIEYYFPSNSLRDVAYRYHEKSYTTKPFEPGRHNNYVIPLEAQAWSASGFGGVSIKRVVTQMDGTGLTYSQWKLRPSSETIGIDATSGYSVYVRSGKLLITMGESVQQLGPGEIVFIPAGSQVKINQTGWQPLVLDVVSR